jgi:plasmid stabilization system protein ParE
MADPAQYQVTFSPLALSDIAEAHALLARLSPDAANRLVLEIREASASLRSMPERGHRQPSVTAPEVRVLVVRRQWLMLFRVSGTPCRLSASSEGTATWLASTSRSR